MSDVVVPSTRRQTQLPVLQLSDEQARRLKVLESVDLETLLVHEIYSSIQGESTYAGLPCVFVRLTGCHLRCHWCDTPHAFAEGSLRSVDDVIAEVKTHPARMVEVTGGEPLIQPGVHGLLRSLADTGRHVLLETSGSASIAAVDPRVTVIMDLKCPGSGETEANDYENLKRLKPDDEIKFVVKDRDDFEWSVRLIRERSLLGRPLLIAPVFGEINYETLSEWILETELPLRLQVQLHKHVWNPDARGV